MKRNFTFESTPVIVLVSIGLGLGLLLTVLCWIFPKSATALFTGAAWLRTMFIIGACLLLCGSLLAERQRYPTASRVVLLLAVAAGTSLVYLFPELFAPGCGKMPRAFAACPAACRHTTCVDWDAPGEDGCNPPKGSKGCCVAYETTCDPDCSDPDDPPPPPPTNPPSISGSIACTTPGSNGWCLNGAVLNLSASDPQGYATTIAGDIAGTSFSCPGPSCAQTLPVGSGTIHFQATAATSGQSSATGTASFAYDPNPPTAVITLAGTPGANGWYLAAAASTTGTDATSGIASTRVSVDGGTWQPSASLSEGAHSVVGRSTDNAGNITTTSSQVVKVDAIQPTISASITSGTLVSGWYVTDVTIKASASDATSGIALVEYRLDSGTWTAGSSLTVTTEGPHTVDFRATDVAGLRSTTSLAFKVDKTAPSISFTLSGTPGENGWYVSPVTLLISAQDALSGVAGIEYCLDGGSWTAGNSLTLNDGDHTVEARAIDIAGNLSAVTAAETVGIHVDTVAPSLNLTLSGMPGKNDWYVSDVTAVATVSDATSGVALTEYSVDGADWQTGVNVTVTPDGPHQVNFRVTDRAGNRSADFRTFKIDQTKPLSAFVFPMEGSSGTVVFGEFGMQGKSGDATSGLNSVQISTDEGHTWLDMAISADGAWRYTWDTRHVPNDLRLVQARAEDLAGNIGNNAQVTLLLANQPPKVSIQESWWIWEAGSLSVHKRFIPIQEIRVQIGCLDGQPDVKLKFTPETLPSALSWDRKCGEGQFATSGDHPVTLTACDQVGNCSSAEGVIKVPFIAPPIPTWTPTIEPTATATATPEATRFTHKPQPTPIAFVVSKPLDVPASTPSSRPENLPFWFFAALTLVGFLMALSAASLADPRPRSLRRLGKTMNEVRNGQG